MLLIRFLKNKENPKRIFPGFVILIDLLCKPCIYFTQLPTIRVTLNTNTNFLAWHFSKVFLCYFFFVLKASSLIDTIKIQTPSIPITLVRPMWLQRRIERESLMSSVSEHQKTVKYKSDTANICPFLSSLTFYWPIHGPIGPRSIL